MLFIIGALAGLAYGLTAVGGSLVAIPMLVILAEVPLVNAMSMNLCMLLILATITAGDGVRARLPVPGSLWPFALVACLAAPVGIAGAWVITTAHAGSLIYAPVLLIAAVATLLWIFRAPAALHWPRGGLAALQPLKTESDNPAPAPAMSYTMAALSGGLTGLTGSSGTIFMLAALGRVLPANTGQAIASVEMALLPVLLVAFVSMLLWGVAIPWQPTGLMIFGALAGLSIARMLARRAAPKVWHLGAAVSLFGLAGWMLFAVTQAPA